MEITKMLTIFNGHVSDETWQKLCRGSDPADPYYMGVTVYKLDDYSFMVCCACMFDNDVPEDTPEDLLACMRLAHEHGCMWLRLDDDGKVLDCLPTY